MRRVQTFLPVILILILSTSVALHSQRNDNSSSTGSVEGIVVNRFTGDPLQGATVELLSKSSITINGVSQRPGFTVKTGIDGQFRINNVIAASYSLHATTAGFLEPDRAQTPSQGITVVSGQVVRNLQIHLVPQSAISGRILDENDRPVSGVTIQLMQFIYDKNGSKGLQPVGGATGAVRGAKTADNGQYRISPILPGEYFLWFWPTSGQQALQSSYYPGVQYADSAARVVAPAGSEQSGIDWRVVKGKRFSFRFTLSMATPLTDRPVFQLRSRGNIREQNLLSGSPRADRDGVYVFSQIAPGAYDVYVQYGSLGDTTSGIQRIPVDVVDRDVDLGDITIKPGSVISGRVIFQGSVLPVSVSIDPFPILNGLQRNIKTDADGAFKFENVSEGQYRINVRPLPDNAYVESARFGLINVLASGVSVDDDHSKSGLEIRIGGPGGRVEGTLQDAKGNAVRDARVAVIPLSGIRESPDLFHVGPTNQEGFFSIDSLPPGDYGVLGWEYLPGEAYKNADFLKAYEALATKVIVLSGMTNRINIKIVPVSK